MRTLTRGLLLLATLGAGGGVAAAPAGAADWAEVASGTTDTITNLEYRADGVWYTTATGGIYKRTPQGTIETRRAPDGAALTDLEFQPGGNVGIAVGTGGKVLRSPDGVAWTELSLGDVASNEGDGTGNQCTVNTAVDTDLNFVRWTSATQAFVGGSKRQFVVSADAGSSWQNANRRTAPPGGDGCRLAGTGPLFDLAPASENSFTVAGGSANVAQSIGAFATGSDAAFVTGGATADGSRPGARLATDPGNSLRAWSVAGGAPTGVSGARYTESGFSAAMADIDVAGGYPGTDAPWDVDAAGGTVVMVGGQGKILNSTDGRRFANGPGAGALATQEWRAVSLRNGTDAAIGGASGRLAISSNANVVPVVASPSPGTGGSPAPSPAPTPATPSKPKLPLPTLAARRTPPLTGKVARVVGRNVVLRVRGRLGLPQGVTRRAGCAGTIALSVSKGKRRLKTKTVKVSSTCTYATTVKVKRSKVGRKTKALKLEVAFRGNAALGKLSSTYTVKVKR